MPSLSGKVLSITFIAAIGIAAFWVVSALGSPVPSLKAFSPLATPTPPPMPTPYPPDWGKPTGGPYISETKAISMAVSLAKGYGEVDQSIAPRAVFTTADGVDKITGYPRPRQVHSEQEVWVVEISGRFNHSRLRGAPVVLSPKLFITIDATSGSVSRITFREYQ